MIFQGSYTARRLGSFEIFLAALVMKVRRALWEEAPTPGRNSLHRLAFVAVNIAWNAASEYAVSPISGRTAGHTTPPPLSTWDRDMLRAVAVAYRRVRCIGERDLPARHAAERAYIERHPMAPADDAQRTVAVMIAALARDHPARLWKGVGAVTR
jgi:hypothetical protein